MNFDKYDHDKTIVGFGLIVLDIIFKNGNNNPFYASGGTCSNVITNLSFLGWSSSIMSRIGNDPAAEIILQDLKQYCVNTNNLYREDGVKTPRIIETLISNDEKNIHKFLLKCPECKNFLPRYRSPTLNQTRDLSGSNIKADVFFYDRISPACLNLAKDFKSNGSLVFFEPNSVKMTDELKRSLNLPHIIKFAYDENKDKEHLIIFEKEVLNLEELGPKLIIKTMGKKGICFKQENKEWEHQNALQTNSIMDTCGAGDWCTSGFLYALDKLSQGNDKNIISTLNDNCKISDALKIGQAIASISLDYVGARGLSYSIDRKQLFSKLRRLIEVENISFCTEKVDEKCINKPVPKPKKGEFCNICLI